MLPLLLMALQAPAAAPPPAPVPTIVVKGVRLSTLKQELDRCVAGGCTPREDVVASVRYAEGLFRQGGYGDAKRVLAASVGRNKGAAKADPVAVSELYLAQSTVALHEGDQDVARAAAYSRANVLKAAYGAEKPAVLMAEMGVADMALRTGQWRDASRMYAGLAGRAAGQPKLAAAIALRRANLADQHGRPAEVAELLGPVIASPGDDMAGYRLAARALQARFARARGDQDATDALLKAVAAEPRQAAPTLLWAPPLSAPEDLGNLNIFDLVDEGTRSSDLLTLGWADVGFLIRPDGSVEEPEVLRGSTKQGWTAPVLKSVSLRRYAPFAGGEGGAGQYRVERFTLTADYDVPKGSLVRRRMRNPHIEQLDITTGAPPPAPRG